MERNRQTEQNTAEEWFADEDFWREFYSVMFAPQRFAEAKEITPKIITLSGIGNLITESSDSVESKTARTALDLCCGPGRIARELQRSGFKVTGVDKSAFLLGKALSGPEYIQADARDYLKPDCFDLAVNVFTSFGYFQTAGENQLVLDNVFASLKPGGIFVIDVIGKERLVACFQPTTSSELPDGRLLIQRHKIIDSFTRIENEWLLSGSETSLRRFKFSHWLYSAAELESMLAASGFIEIKSYGDWDGGPYTLTPGGNRLIMTARRPIAANSPDFVKSTEPWEIIDLTPAHWSAALELWNKSEGMAVTTADTLEGFRAYLKRNPGFSIAAVDQQGRLIATALTGHDNRRGYLYHLAVNPKWRRRGLGRALAQECCRRLTSAGLEKCHLFVLDNNSAAIDFYRRIGFKLRRDISIMSRDLS